MGSESSIVGDEMMNPPLIVVLQSQIDVKPVGSIIDPIPDMVKYPSVYATGKA
ncbi:hypothetical protein ABIC03_005320 [Bradyrhizobium sp. RT6a]